MSHENEKEVSYNEKMVRDSRNYKQRIVKDKPSHVMLQMDSFGARFQLTSKPSASGVEFAPR